MTASATDPLALERIHASGLVAQVEYHASLPSTQLRVHEIANDGNAGKLPLLIVAEEQTAGRGRGANRWWTGRGSLAFSLMFDPGDWNLSRRPAPERSLVVGVAIVDALQPRHGQCRARSPLAQRCFRRPKEAGRHFDRCAARRPPHRGHRHQREQFVGGRAGRRAGTRHHVVRLDRRAGGSNGPFARRAGQLRNGLAQLRRDAVGIRRIDSSNCACKRGTS